MKKFLLLFFGLFIVVPVNAASSKFEPTITTDSEIKNNEITIVIGYKGENVNNISNYIGYNKEMLDLVSINGQEEFKFNVTDEVVTSKYKTFKVDANNENIYNDANYISLTFKLTNNFKNNGRADIYFYTYNAFSEGTYKYRHDGVHLALKRDSNDYMSYVLENINKYSKIKQNFYDYMYFYIGGAILFFIIVIFVIIIPANNRNAKKKQSVENFDIESTNTNSDDLIKFDFSDLNQSDELLDNNQDDIAFKVEEKDEILDTSNNEEYEEFIDPFKMDTNNLEDKSEDIELPLRKDN